MDPRNYQIAALGTFVLIGVTHLGFQIDWVNALVIIATALFTQACLFSPCFISSCFSTSGQWKSALISSMSLVLLLRTDVVAIAALASFIAIASKRFIRFDGNHIFNPSALALVLVTGLSSHAYISPGQWGALGLVAFLVLGIGLLVVTRAHRLDVALAFLLCFASVVLLRGMYLGDPIAIALHQLQSGALLLFAFFMITDPKTTPAHRAARIVFGVTVAVVAAILQFKFYLSTAAIYALVALAPLVPLFNTYTRSLFHVNKSIRLRKTIVGVKASVEAGVVDSDQSRSVYGISKR